MANNKLHVRSISLPTRPHPSTARVEEQLNKLQAWESEATSGSSSSSSSLFKGLSGLEELYECVGDLLQMGSTQQVLSKNQHENKYYYCLEDLLDGSLRLLDICGVTRDVLLQTKEHVGALQSGLRRRKGDPTMETNITAYNCFRKKMKKQVKKLSLATKQVNKRFEAQSIIGQDDDDHHHHFCAVMSSLRQVCAMNSSIFQALFVYLMAPKVKSKWSLVSKLVHKSGSSAVACEEKLECGNELESVDVALSSLFGCCDGVKLQTAQKKSEALEMSLDGLENGLESLFRKLIRTRTSLLNIISQ
ncbi:uncharacterized protein LOC133782262 [Humulus lupulus]|uniref:uncharacterized protein LOC133782262 n=1 Tax=Humulus lupulus TaxID=3486 RepID=UPI002B403F87|nr:uncharacterized protein LOC133782262 [Humulus lupulus]